MWFLDYQKYPDFTNAKGWTVCVGGLCQGITKQILTYIYMHCSGLQIAPFAASHSRGTKLPCWRAKVELGWEDLPHFLYIFSKLFFKIIILPQILWSFQCILHSSWWLCFFITIFFCIIKASRIGALIRISWEPLWVDWISELKCVNLFTLFWVSF